MSSHPPDPFEPDKIVYDFLVSKYDTYRNSLTDPTNLPAYNDILWGSPKSEVKTHAFMVNLLQIDRSFPFLGKSRQKCRAVVLARFATMNILTTVKPNPLKYFQEFIDYEISTYQIDSYFKDKGVSDVLPFTSTIVEPRNPETDAWILNFQIIVNYSRGF